MLMKYYKVALLSKYKTSLMRFRFMLTSLNLGRYDVMYIHTYNGMRNFKRFFIVIFRKLLVRPGQSVITHLGISTAWPYEHVIILYVSV